MDKIFVDASLYEVRPSTNRMLFGIAICVTWGACPGRRASWERRGAGHVAIGLETLRCSGGLRS